MIILADFDPSLNAESVFSRNVKNCSFHAVFSLNQKKQVIYRYKLIAGLAGK